MEKGFFIVVVVVATFWVGQSESQIINSTETLVGRDGKALSVFQVVRFPNVLCVGTSSLNGTCYTTSECTNKGGTAAGSCANGFGVCCTFTLGCGSTTSENTTYFLSSTSTVPGGQCGVTVCKCSNDVCQLRLDFNTFVIAGPSTVTLSLGLKEVAGSVSKSGTNPVSAVTQCLTDTFQVSGSPGGNPPVICGTNTGYHMYAELTSCDTIDFQLGPTGIGTTIPTRQWNIRITQISCLDPNRAPNGCVQYYFGSISGVIYSYNYAASTVVQLANQNQRICFRRERSYCKLCLSTATGSDFAVSSAGAIGYTSASKCCGYGADGITTKGYDCFVIPQAMKGTANANFLNNAFCGGVGFATADAKTSTTTVCTAQIPFKVEFITDGYSKSIASTVYKGFRIFYWQTTC